MQIITFKLEDSEKLRHLQKEHYYIKFKFKILLSLNNTVCDNYTNYTHKHVTKRT